MERLQAGNEAPTEDSIAFYRHALGVQVVRRTELAQGLYTMNDLAPPGEAPTSVEMIRQVRRNGCNLAYIVPDVEAACRKLQACGAVICKGRPQGSVARACSPVGLPAELIQSHAAPRRVHAC
ncbi:MAG: hypothetical protein GAK35_04170 [Herbaspirillum frisingense]|uniref:VOC domain-containing protein n=1 Tax=Herbaspirillum frisingense TaxID=92645 RepID=A0A7V8FT90_9BURK|nr:MAG: hypothetical protein GAK35_04170 [Herbaspirillum frisingense]